MRTHFLHFKSPIIRTIAGAAIGLFVGLQSAAALDISNSTNTPSTNAATVYVDITNVAGAATATCYYGTTDGGTSAILWAGASNYADVTNGHYGLEITNLVSATWYFYRWYADDESNSAWAGASSNLITLSRPPTNYPAPATGITVIATEDGVLLAPTNFFGANGIIGAGAVESNFDAHIAATNPHSITPELIGALAASSNFSDVADPAAARSNLGAAAAGDLGAVETNLADHQSATNPHSITPALIGALAASSNLSDVADPSAARSNLGAASQSDMATLQSNLSYQAFGTNLLPNDGGTCTITYASGSLICIIANTNITLTFDNTSYPTNGVNRVGVEIWASTNSVAFDAAVISNAVAPTIYTNRWTSMFFRRTATNLWYGRQ